MNESSPAGANITETILRRFKASNADRDRTVRLVRECTFEYCSEWTDGTLRRFITDIGLDLIDDVLALRSLIDGASELSIEEKNRRLADGIELKKRVSSVLESGDPLDIKDLAVNGSQLMEELHMEKGRTIGRLLRHLLDCVLDRPEFNNQETLLKLGRNWLDKSRQ